MRYFFFQTINMNIYELNFSFLFIHFFIYLLISILLSQHLYEKAWYAWTEVCLIMTIFKDEFNAQFVLFFTALLFSKTFHWLTQERVNSVCIFFIFYLYIYLSIYLFIKKREKEKKNDKKKLITND